MYFSIEYGNLNIMGVNNMARIEKENLIGKHLVWKGEFDLGSNFIPAIFCTNRKNDFIVEDNGIEIQVSLTAKANTKEISLMASKKIEYVELFKLLFDLLKYGNLFDGRFYSIHELSLDGIDIMAIIIEEWLPYYRSKKAYTYICINYDNDDEYKDLFLKWKDMCQELDIIHQMFLYACYSTDITPDVKLALLLQTFEPIADKLYDKGVINLVKPPYIGKSAPCDICGNIVCVNIKNKNLHFSERLQAIVDKYRTGIFDNDKIDI